MCADVSCWSICDRSDQGNAGALNALDPSACFFLRLSKHTSTHMLTSSPSHLPLVGYPPPLSLAASSPSVRPLRIQTASQSGTLSSPTFVIGWRALWMRILSFERQSRLSWLRRSLSLSVSLSRVISLSPPLFCNTTTTCWFLTKPLLLLPLTPPLLLSSAVLFYSLLIISFFAPINHMLTAPPLLSFLFPVHFLFSVRVSPQHCHFVFDIHSSPPLSHRPLTWGRHEGEWSQFPGRSPVSSLSLQHLSVLWTLLYHPVDASVRCPWRRRLQLCMLQVWQLGSGGRMLLWLIIWRCMYVLA